MLKTETMKRTIIFLLTAIAVVSCEFLDPRPIEDLTTDELLGNAVYGEGLLAQAYAILNTEYIDYTEYYTDNAVPAVPGGNSLALGNWTVQGNPIGQWDAWYEAIGYLNMYLRDCKNLLYSVSDPALNKILQKQRRGEAYFMRAWYQWLLLRTYAGYPAGGGECLGFPIVTDVLSTSDNLDRPRNTYEECVAQIAKDCDSAIVLLPKWYNGSASYNNNSNAGRGSAMAAWALKARVYLYAASPAYGPSTQDLWVRAAQVASQAMDYYGGLNLHDFNYTTNNSGSLTNIWIQPEYSSNNWEYSFYPPSLFGYGACNPSQNLVDAFPVSNGYPIDETTLYNPSNPYASRDGRFDRFIFRNGTTQNGTVVQTYIGGDDAPGGLSLQGTRTGYYLRKLLNSNVRLTPGDVTTSYRFRVFLSKTELYLNFIEAANEAYGPDDATLGYSANTVLALIRNRAGIDSDPLTAGQQDQYRLDQAAAGKDAFRELVRNERRLELCFEGHRFWDIRRWNLPLDHTVKGVKITKSDLPDPTNLAPGATVSTDYCSPWETLSAVNDGFTPTSSTDNSHGKYGNWNSAGVWRYIQYDFAEPTSIAKSEIYWFTDGGGLLLPTQVYIEYYDSATDTWKSVENPSGYAVAADTWTTTVFNTVVTTGIRINFTNTTQSVGVIEWRVWNINYDSYDYVDVETHTFQDYMRYVPVPYRQTLIMSNLKQNSGW